MQADGLQELAGHLSCIGQSAGQQRVEGCAQAIHIRPPVQAWMSWIKLLRRGKRRRARQHPSTPLPQGHQAEIRHQGMHLTLVPNFKEDVRRLHIQVDHALPVGGVEGLRHVPDGFNRRVLDHGKVRQGAPCHELQRDEGAALVFPHLVHLADVRMLHAGLGAGLLQMQLRVAGLQQLERHPALEAVVEGPEDPPVAACADQGEVPVGADACWHRTRVRDRGRGQCP